MNAAPTPPNTPIEAKPILDYASPRSHGKLRLPSRSILEWRWAGAVQERHLVVTERLRGRAAAATVLALGLFTFVLLAVVLCNFVLETHWPSQAVGEGGPFVVASILLCLSEAAVMVLVIRNTWRQTILKTVDGELHLTFSAWVGLSARCFRWLPGAVAEVRVVLLDPELGSGELQIFPKGHATLKLFTDHDKDRLQMLAALLRKELRLP